MSSQLPEPERTKSPLSPDRLREAFSQMLGRGAKDKKEVQPSDSSEAESPAGQCEISPRSIVEAILFIGGPDDRSWSARELAAAMRNVSPREVTEAVHQLNQLYAQDGSPYEIVESVQGFQFNLKPAFALSRDEYYGRAKEAKLSQQAIEVLSIVAYYQPISMEQINSVRKKPSGHLLAMLVRRKLLCVERPPDRPRQPNYTTTDRFLRVFSLESLEELPRSEELEVA